MCPFAIAHRACGNALTREFQSPVLRLTAGRGHESQPSPHAPCSTAQPALPTQLLDLRGPEGAGPLRWCIEVANAKLKRNLGMSPEAAYLIEKAFPCRLPAVLPAVYEVFDRVVDLSESIVPFSANTGDAWMPRPADHLVVRLARGGDPLPVHIERPKSGSPLAGTPSPWIPINWADMLAIPVGREVTLFELVRRVPRTAAARFTPWFTPEDPKLESGKQNATRGWR